MTGDPTVDLVAELRRRGVSDVDDSVLARALYSSDASLYRVEPRVVVRPRHTDELLAILDVARTVRVPVTMRGAGTSIAGNAVGPGIVVDTARHLNRVVSVDPDARTAVVQPGVVHATLQREAAPHGLRFGPDPSTHTRCTIGGMVGNNACGSRALGYGRTADNVAGLRVAYGSGDEPHVRDALTGLVDGHLAHVRQSFGRFSRQVSGYSLEHLLPENGRRLDRFLVGSEGTLGVVLEATVELVPDEPRRLVVLGYPSMAEAADAVPTLLAEGQRLVACEGLDSRIVDLVRAAGSAVPPLPKGAGWLFVEVGEGGTVPAAGELERRAIDDPAEAAALWRIREDGAGLAARSLDRPAYSGWEDAAVPPDRLGAWLREFDDLLEEHGLRGVPYGHFGDGCVHVRIDFDFDDDGGRRRFREFLVAGATALRAHGGSLSGEHGDGRARSELLPLMYDEESLRLFGAVKAICDPDNLLNPGVLVDPAPVDADLRPARPRATVASALRLTHDGGSLGEAVHRCTGVGKCVAPTTVGGDVPVPPGHPGREGLHPRPRPRAPGGARRLARPGPRRPRRHRGARPLPVLQGLRAATAPPAWTWRRTRRRCCTSSTPAGDGRGRTTRWAGSRAGSPWRGRWPAPSTGWPAGRSAGWSRPVRASTRVGRCRRSLRCRSGRVSTLRDASSLGSSGQAKSTDAVGRRTAPTCGSGRTRSPTASSRRTRPPRSGCSLPRG